ncbi:hypothetical protein CTI12_AA610610 [Artemisia annua]|uniref:Aconitase/3-isopropylmalate dehydratase large subunit alpha/beta/alpha domain-containing protein n=1 Tax=Artemisia annua TaxID=35608 RepID=A0A2U1KF51_ARTAN|nr:hypothetical protein CTI12_AA610610 [Artemisia annua]
MNKDKVPSANGVVGTGSLSHPILGENQQKILHENENLSPGNLARKRDQAVDDKGTREIILESCRYTLPRRFDNQGMKKATRCRHCRHRRAFSHSKAQRVITVARRRDGQPVKDVTSGQRSKGTGAFRGSRAAVTELPVFGGNPTETSFPRDGPQHNTLPEGRRTPGERRQPCSERNATHYVGTLTSEPEDFSGEYVLVRGSQKTTTTPGYKYKEIAMLEAYLRANNMFVDYNEPQQERVYSSYLDLDLSEVEHYLMTESLYERHETRLALLPVNWAYNCSYQFSSHLCATDLVIDFIDLLVTFAYIIASAVLSGNRNFEGRVHALTRANYLASPLLVVAYALAGTFSVEKQYVMGLNTLWVQTLEEIRLLNDNTQIRSRFEKDANSGPTTSGASSVRTHATTRTGGECS